MILQKFRWRLAKKLSVHATNFSGWLLRNRKWQYDEMDYRNLPDGTVGKELINYMDKIGITFKPNLVKHDIKHILTGYQMKTKDEIKIQAFLLGNRCTNWFSVIYLFVNLILLPEIIFEVLKDYKRGTKAIRLRSIHLEGTITKNLNNLKQELRLLN